jgi:hypothetical protein
VCGREAGCQFNEVSMVECDPIPEPPSVRLLLRNRQVGGRGIHLNCVREPDQQQFVRNRAYAAADVEERLVVPTLRKQSGKKKARGGRGTAGAVAAQVASSSSRIEQNTGVFAVPAASQERTSGQAPSDPSMRWLEWGLTSSFKLQPFSAGCSGQPPPALAPSTVTGVEWSRSIFQVPSSWRVRIAVSIQ